MSTRSIATIAVLLSLLSFVGTAAGEPNPGSLPPFELLSLSGSEITEQDLMGDVALLFVIPDNVACEKALELLLLAESDYGDVQFVLLFPADTPGARAMIDRLAIAWPAVIDNQLLLASIMSVGSVPNILTLRDGKVVGELEPGFGMEELRTTLSTLADGPSEPNETGTPSAPVVSFSKLPRPLLLMFAGANCSYCHYILPEVLRIAEWFDVSIVITEEVEDPGPFESDAAQLSIILDPTWQLATLFDVWSVPHITFLNRACCVNSLCCWSSVSNPVEDLHDLARSTDSRQLRRGWLSCEQQ